MHTEPSGALVPTTPHTLNRAERTTILLAYILALLCTPLTVVLLYERRSAFAHHHVKVATLLMAMQLSLLMLSFVVPTVLTFPLQVALSLGIVFEMVRALRGRQDGPLAKIARAMIPGTPPPPQLTAQQELDAARRPLLPPDAPAQRPAYAPPHHHAEDGNL